MLRYAGGKGYNTTDGEEKERDFLFIFLRAKPYILCSVDGTEDTGLSDEITLTHLKVVLVKLLFIMNRKA